VDEHSVQTGEIVKASAPIPSWGWVFIVACAIVPFITRGGAIPAALGVGGAFGCLIVVRDSPKSTSKRVLLCVGITLLAWVLTLVLGIEISLLAYQK
jgi:hypothetical protein